MAIVVRSSFQAYFIALLTVLKQEMKFTVKNMEELMKWVADYINGFHLKYFTDNDLIDVLAEETGFQLVA